MFAPRAVSPPALPAHHPLPFLTPSLRPAAPATLAVRFGKRLRYLRKEKGLTQQQLAERFGIDRCYISEIENGRRSITLHILEVIADGFKMTLPDLFSHLD